MGNWGKFGHEVKAGEVPAFDHQKTPPEDSDVLSWDDEVEGEALPDLITLEPGEYEFTVHSFSRGLYEGGIGKDGKKISSCPTAKYTLEIQTPAGLAMVKDTFWLRKSSMWKIAVFFRCIGMGAADGKPFIPKWQEAVGRTGIARINNREYNEKKYNNVQKYIEPAK